jgi:hypothetical protein
LEPPKEDSAEIVSATQFFAACGKAASPRFTCADPRLDAGKLYLHADRASMSWQQQSGTH